MAVKKGFGYHSQGLIVEIGVSSGREWGVKRSFPWSLARAPPPESVFGTPTGFFNDDLLDQCLLCLFGTIRTRRFMVIAIIGCVMSEWFGKEFERGKRNGSRLLGEVTHSRRKREEVLLRFHALTTP